MHSSWGLWSGGVARTSLNHRLQAGKPPASTIPMPDVTMKPQASTIARTNAAMKPSAPMITRTDAAMIFNADTSMERSFKKSYGGV